MSVRTYDPKDVQIIVGGVPMSGFADGTFIAVEFDESTFSKTVGADGEVSRAKSNNKSATATITLKQTSPSNAVLSGFALVDEATNAGVVPFMIREIGTGSTLVFAESAWIQDWAGPEYSKEVEDREWKLALAQCYRFVGGNEFT
jgi:hypothetical protein